MAHSILAKTLFEAQIIDESVYNFSVLLEDRIDFIKSKYKNALDGVVDTVAEHIDPSKNKKYTEWLVDRHLKGDDIFDPKVKESLHYFDKASSAAHDTNIKNHTVQSLHDVAHIVKNSQQSKGDVKPLEEVYSEGDVKGYRIPNKATSIAIYGPGKKHAAQWCTSTPTGNNMFDRYDGGKYTMHFPNGAFMQIHHESGQTKDPANEEIDLHTDQRYKPYVKHIEKFMRQTADLDHHDHSLPDRHFGVAPEKFEQQWQQYKNEGYSQDFLRNAERNKLSDEQFDLLHRKGWNEKLAANPHLNDEQLHKLIDAGVNNYQIYEHPNLKTEHVDKLFDRALNGGRATRIANMKTLQPKHVDTLLSHAYSKASPLYNNATATLKEMAETGNHKFTDEQIDHMQRLGLNAEYIPRSQTVPEHHRVAFLQRLNSHQIRHNANAYGLLDFAKHNEIHPHEVHEMLDNAEVSHNPLGAMSTILQIKQAKPEHIERIQNEMMKSHDLGGSSKLLESDKLSDDFVNHWVGSTDADGSRRYMGFSNVASYLKRRNSSAATLHNVLKNYNPASLDSSDLAELGFHQKKDLPHELLSDADHAAHIAKNLQYHPKLKAEHLDKLLDGVKAYGEKFRKYPSESMLNGIMNHPNVTTRHFNRLVDEVGDDFFDRKVIREHPKTPPSVVKRIKQIDAEELQ